MAKDTRPVSLSLDIKTHDAIKDAAKKMGHKNVSLLIRELATKYLDLLVNEAEDIPVIIKIPEKMKNSDDLREWLHIKADAIADALRS